MAISKPLIVLIAPQLIVLSVINTFPKLHASECSQQPLYTIIVTWV